MKKYLTIGVLGLLAVGGLLSQPATARADGFGLNLNFGRGGISFFAADPAPCYVPPPPPICVHAPVVVYPRPCGYGPTVIYRDYGPPVPVFHGHGHHHHHGHGHHGYSGHSRHHHR